MNQMRTWVALCLNVLVGVFLVSSALGAPAAPQRGGTLIIGHGTDVTTLDGHFYTDAPTAAVEEHILETLVDLEPDGDLAARLATSWSVSADGRTWTFRLRTGVRFHDGTPFNAEAAKFNLDRILDANNRARWRAIIERITNVTVVDANTLRLVTNGVFGPLLANLSHSGIAIQSPTAIQRLGADYARQPVGTGAFKFKEWVRGDRVVLTRFDDYWGDKALLDEVQFKVIPDDGARVLALESGAVHVAVRIPPRDITRLEQNRALQIDRTESLRTIYVFFNTQRPPFNDKRVRQAFNYAVNKRAIVSSALANTARVSDAPIAPNVIGYSRIMTYDPDIERARQLLAEAGFPRGLQATFHHPTGRYVRDAEIAASIQALVRRIGIDLRLVTMEFGAYINTILTPLAQNQVQMGFLGWGAVTGDADYGLYQLFHSSQWAPGFNTAFYKNETVDRQLDQARTTGDQAARSRLYRQVMQTIMDDAPWLFLHSESQVTGVRQEAQGVVVHPAERVMAHRAWLRR